MISKQLLPTFFILIFVSCKNIPNHDKPKQETPKALQDKNSSLEIISKRSYDDIVENLYSELLEKNKDLKKIEEGIVGLNDSKQDTTAVFYSFNDKSQNYYNSANRHLGQLSDSLLKEKMKALITNSLTKYNLSIEKHNSLLKTIQSKSTTINDLHIILKITNTIPLIDKFQKDNLPSTKPLEGFVSKQNELIKLADTLTKQ